jgi:hypothetical protein
VRGADRIGALAHQRPRCADRAFTRSVSYFDPFARCGDVLLEIHQVPFSIIKLSSTFDSRMLHLVS